jgi:hypothetical protein
MFMPLPLAKAKNGKDYKVGKKQFLQPMRWGGMHPGAVFSVQKLCDVVAQTIIGKEISPSLAIDQLWK